MVIFSKEDCEYIKSVYYTENEFDATTVQDYGDVKIKFSNASSKYVITQNKELTAFLLEKLKPHGVKSIPEIKYMKYQVGDNLARHTDFSKYGVDIIFKTYLFQLSDSDEYTGGDLIVGNTIQSREQGTMTVISPTTPHEVTKVTSGERLSLVIFLREENLNLSKSII
jgi:predicted 2-oxoglutarate/Fe(II)-dependent dioxygenase YbiX